MGGLVSMMYAAKHPETPALLLFAPSPPLEVQGKATLQELRGAPLTPFGPELYGVYPDDPEASRPAMPDLTDEEIARVLRTSAGATGERPGPAAAQERHQRRRPSPARPSSSTATRTRRLSRRTAASSRAHLGGDSMTVPGAGHWGIVYSERIVAMLAPAVDDWLRRTLEAS